MIMIQNNYHDDTNNNDNDNIFLNNDNNNTITTRWPTYGDLLQELAFSKRVLSSGYKRSQN